MKINVKKDRKAIKDIIYKGPKIMWHHGTCDLCNRRFTLVCHFGYNTQPKRDYMLCLKCFNDYIQTILYGWTNYKVDEIMDKLGKERINW